MEKIRQLLAVLGVEVLVSTITPAESKAQREALSCEIEGLRQKLKDDGVLATEQDHLLFTRDAEFSSPSAAAALIQGGHANGLTAWKNRNGKTLKELESG
jgi:hypothetical protein